MVTRRLSRSTVDANRSDGGRRISASPRPDPYDSCTLIHMRTTLNLREELVAEARQATGIKEKTALIHAGLQALVDREKARRLAAMGGSQP